MQSHSRSTSYRRCCHPLHRRCRTRRLTGGSAKRGFDPQLSLDCGANYIPSGVFLAIRFDVDFVTIVFAAGEFEQKVLHGVFPGDRRRGETRIGQCNLN